jgi:hypothetical protein
MAAGVNTGCTSGRDVALKSEDFIGDYTYISADRGAQHDPDTLTLRADGKYLLVHMTGGHPGSKEEGEWRLEKDPAPSVLLGKAGYPAEIRGGKGRLLVNNDLGQWYEKTQ